MFSNNSFRPSFPGMNTPSYTHMKRMHGSTYTFVISDHDIAWGLGLLALYSLFNNRFGRACFRVVYELLLVYVLANIMHKFAKLYMQTQP